MAVPQISPLPPVPVTGTPANLFTGQADTLLLSLNQLTTQANAIPAAVETVVAGMTIAYNKVIASRDTVNGIKGDVAILAANTKVSADLTQPIAASIVAVNPKPWTAADQGKPLQVKPNGLVSPGTNYKAGQVLISARNPGNLWLKGNTRRSILAFPTLYNAIKRGSDTVSTWLNNFQISNVTAAVGDMYSAGGTTIVVMKNATVMRLKAPLLNNANQGTPVTLKSSTTYTYITVSGDGNGLWLIFTNVAGESWRSTDDGVTWTQFSMALPSNSSLEGICRVLCDGNGTWAATPPTSRNYVYFSYDNGATWAGKTVPGTLLFLTLACDGKGTWVIGGTYLAYRSTDNGSSWAQVLSINSSYTISCIGTDKQGTWVLASASGVCYRSADNGLNWFAVTFSWAVQDVIYYNGLFYFACPSTTVILGAAADVTSPYAVPSSAPAGAFRITALRDSGEILTGSQNNNAGFGLAYPVNDGMFRLPDLGLKPGVDAWFKAGETLGYLAPYFYQYDKYTYPAVLLADATPSYGDSVYVFQSGNAQAKMRFKGNLVIPLGQAEQVRAVCTSTDTGKLLVVEGVNRTSQYPTTADIRIYGTSNDNSLLLSPAAQPGLVTCFADIAYANGAFLVAVMYTGGTQGTVPTLEVYRVNPANYSIAFIGQYQFDAVGEVGAGGAGGVNPTGMCLTMDDLGNWIVITKEGLYLKSEKPLTPTSTQGNYSRGSLFPQGVTAIARNGNLWLAAVNYGTLSQLMRSINAGGTWTVIKSYPRIQSLRLRADGAAIATFANAAPVVSSDSGLTWQTMTESGWSSSNLQSQVRGGRNNGGFILYDPTQGVINMNPVGIY